MAFKAASAGFFQRSKLVLDYLATVFMIVVAGVILWRLLHSPSATPARAKDGNAVASPPLPKEPLSLAGAAVQGDARANVAIIEFSDFQCPYCARFATETLPAFLDKYVKPGRVLFAFRHMPLRIHPVAQKAAASAECARRQEKFWPMHDRFFENQGKLPRIDWLTEAAAIGLDSQSFRTCLDAEGGAAVRSDEQLAKALGVAGTPTFFVGTRQPDGRVKVLNRLAGTQTLEKLEKVVAPLMNTKPSN